MSLYREASQEDLDQISRLGEEVNVLHHEAWPHIFACPGDPMRHASHWQLTQDAVAERMGTTKSAVSRLEAAGKHAPSLATLKRYASAVGCTLQVKLVRHKAT